MDRYHNSVLVIPARPLYTGKRVKNRGRAWRSTCASTRGVIAASGQKKKKKKKILPRSLGNKLVTVTPHLLTHFGGWYYGLAYLQKRPPPLNSRMILFKIKEIKLNLRARKF